MEIRDHLIRGLFIPNKLVFKNTLYTITKLPKKFYIKDYIIKTVNDNIDLIIINVPHPNANPKNGNFCIPHKLREEKISDNIKVIIQTMLCCFNLNDCYFTPWDEIEYEEQEVL